MDLRQGAGGTTGKDGAPIAGGGRKPVGVQGRPEGVDAKAGAGASPSSPPGGEGPADGRGEPGEGQKKGAGGRPGDRRGVPQARRKAWTGAGEGPEGVRERGCGSHRGPAHAGRVAAAGEGVGGPPP